MGKLLFFLAAAVLAVGTAEQRHSYGESVTRHAMQRWLQVEKAIEQRHPLIDRKRDSLNRRMTTKFRGGL